MANRIYVLVGFALLLGCRPVEKTSTAFTVDPSHHEQLPGEEGVLLVRVVAERPSSPDEAKAIANHYLSQLIAKYAEAPKRPHRWATVHLFGSRAEFEAAVPPYCDASLKITPVGTSDLEFDWHWRDESEAPSEREQQIYLDHMKRTIAAEKLLLVPFDESHPAPHDDAEKIKDWSHQRDGLLRAAHNLADAASISEYSITLEELQTITAESGDWFYSNVADTYQTP